MDLAKRWRQKPAYYRLEGQRHRLTGEIRFPPQPPRPGEDAADWEACPLKGTGEIYSFTGIRNTMPEYEQQAPYLVGVVRLDEGILVSAQLTDCGEADLMIGQRVEMVTRRMGDTGADGLLVYGYKFRPVIE